VTNDGQWHLYEFNTIGSGWTSFSSGDGSVDGPTFTLDGLYFTAPNQANDWVMYIDDVSYHQAGPLPVQLLAFQGSVIGNDVRLQWSTSTETDCYGFEIERRTISSFGSRISDFETVRFIPGNGTTSSVSSYEFIDPSPPAGRVAYRLRQIDRTGAYAYSGELEVSARPLPLDPLLVRAYPNPFNPSTTIEFRSLDGGPASLRVYDLLGRLVATLFDGPLSAGADLQRIFDASGLPSGMYVVRLEQLGRARSSKLILSR
jgi:hypothetical protein